MEPTESHPSIVPHLIDANEKLKKQNAEYIEALRELKRFIPSLRVLVDRQFNEPQNCFDLFDEIEAMKL